MGSSESTSSRSHERPSKSATWASPIDTSSSPSKTWEETFTSMPEIPSQLPGGRHSRGTVDSSGKTSSKGRIPHSTSTSFSFIPDLRTTIASTDNPFSRQSTLGAPTLENGSVTATSGYTIATSPGSSQTNPPTVVVEDKGPLSNGATAGIVLAVVAVLLGATFLLRYIYKTRGLCGRGGKAFSPLVGPYNGPSGPHTGSFNSSVPRGDLDTWLAYHGASTHGAPTWSQHSAGQPDSVELRSFTRPPHAPKAYNIGGSETEGVPGGSPGSDQVRPSVSPQTHVDSPAQGAPNAPASRGSRKLLPWDDGFQEDRYRTW